MKYRDHDLSLSASRIRLNSKPTSNQLEMCSIVNNSYPAHLTVTHNMMNNATNNNAINNNNNNQGSRGQSPLLLDEDGVDLKRKLTKLSSKSDKSLDSMSEEGIGSIDGEIVSCCSSLSCSSTSVAGIETSSSSFGYGSLQTSSASPSPRSVTPSSRPESRNELINGYVSRKGYNSPEIVSPLSKQQQPSVHENSSSESVQLKLETVKDKPMHGKVETIKKGKSKKSSTFPSTSSSYRESSVSNKWEQSKLSSEDNHGWTRPKVNTSNANEVIRTILAQPMSSLEKDLLLCPGSRIPLRRYTSELNLSSSVSGFYTSCTSFPSKGLIDSDYNNLTNSRLSSKNLSQSKQSLSSFASSSSPSCSSSPSPPPPPFAPSTCLHSSSLANRRRNSDLDLDQLGRLNDGWLDDWTSATCKLWSKNTTNSNRPLDSTPSSSTTSSCSSCSHACDHHSDDGYSSSSSPGGSFGRESGSVSLYELKKLRQRNYQRKRKNQILWSPSTRSRLLVQIIKLNNPISVAMQLTAIDKDLYLQIRPTEMSALLLGRLKKFDSDDLNGVRTLLEFSEQVKKLVCSVINRETSSESQARKIAAFIEVACVLRKLRNWHSLEAIIKALQSPSVYFLETAWTQTKEQFPIHFSDFLRLTSLVNLCDNYILRMSPSKPSIPNFRNLVHFLEIQCAAKFDLCENKPKWIEPPSIAGWLNNELVQDIRASIGLTSINSNNDDLVVATLDPSKTTLIPGNEPVRFIVPSTLPLPWINCEPRSISSAHRNSVTFYVLTAFEEELRNIRRFKMRRNPI
ncbi:phosphatidylinositol 3-kinase 2 [Tetranychus urticae]|uniref:Ras-GEF domain-containing protein n=1 Tax=Tetranychus urticae TaxID=32264 RepID=T1K3C1_TETUR|nr:phosphatidylinositol 3-kinase 2 [Tetranychus urticae]